MKMMVNCYLSIVHVLIKGYAGFLDLPLCTGDIRPLVLCPELCNLVKLCKYAGITEVS